jgi:hypothetical protein
MSEVWVRLFYPLALSRGPSRGRVVSMPAPTLAVVNKTDSDEPGGIPDKSRALASIAIRAGFCPVFGRQRNTPDVLRLA